MNRYKRQRNTTTNDCDDENKKKLPYTSSLVATINRNRNLVTRFEDLSNELMYDIFEFFDAYYLYKIFFDLNIRLRNLCIHSNHSISTNYSSLSKLTFQHYYTDFIIPTKHQIRSLRLSDPFIIDLFSSSTQNISNCSQLRTLVLDNIESECAENLLINLISLSNLSSLVIHINDSSNKINIYNLIFQLPVLKYCDLSFGDSIPLGSLPISTSPSSPIEQFIIKDNYDLNGIDTILSYLPRIRRLSFTTHHGPNTAFPILFLILLNNSTQVSFTLGVPQSDEIEQFIKKWCHQIKFLHFSKTYFHSNFNAEAWKKSISSYLPHFKIIRFNDSKEIFCGYTFEIYNYIFGSYELRSYDTQQWFFSHEPMSEEYLHNAFCSFTPHKRQYYIITKGTFLNKCTCHVKSAVNSVHNVIIEDEDVIFCGKTFPNTTELTLTIRCTNRRDWFASDEFHRMIPLSQLTKLTIHHKYKFLKVLDMLVQTPNIHTLTLTCLELFEREILSMKQSESFRLVSNRNKIKNVVITKQYTLKTIEMLIRLCSGLQHLTLGAFPFSSEKSVKFLLTKHIRTPCHVSSLCILNVDTMWIDRLKTIVKSIKRRVDCSLKVVSSNFYLWWGQ